MENVIKEAYDMEMELVPQECHRRNATEMAIRKSKAYFLSVLAGTAADFPPSLWDRLLLRVDITVNLLRQSNSTLNVSAHIHLSGPFDYNICPWCQWDAQCNCMIKRTRGALRRMIQCMVGMWQPHLSTIALTCATSWNWEGSCPPTQHISITSASPIPQSLTQTR